MFGGSGRADWAAWVVIVPISAVTVAVVLVALFGLAARRRGTRRYCLRLIEQLTRYLDVLRSRR